MAEVNETASTWLRRSLTLGLTATSFVLLSVTFMPRGRQESGSSGAPVQIMSPYKKKFKAQNELSINQYIIHSANVNEPLRIKKIINWTRMQCCGSGMFIPDPNFLTPRSRIQIFSIPDPGSASKNWSNLTQKTVSKLSEIYPDCSFRIRILIIYPSRIPDPLKISTNVRGSDS